MEKFECVDGMRHTDLRPIVKHQQRAICTATKAEMRDLHTGGPRAVGGGRGVCVWLGGGMGIWTLNKEIKSVTKRHLNGA